MEIVMEPEVQQSAIRPKTRAQKSAPQRSSEDMVAAAAGVAQGRAVIVTKDESVLVIENLVKEVFGTVDPDFVHALVYQILSAVSGQKMNEADLLFVVSFIRDAKPRNQMETLLVAQMALIHLAT